MNHDAGGRDEPSKRLAAALACFDELADTIQKCGARRSVMMGRPMLAVGSRMIACLDASVLGVRLVAGTAEHAAALAIPGASVFSPGGGGRIFRDWVGLPVVTSSRWDEFTMVALRRWCPQQDSNLQPTD